MRSGISHNGEAKPVIIGDNLNGEMLRGSTTSSNPTSPQSGAKLHPRNQQRLSEPASEFGTICAVLTSILLESAVCAGLFWLTCDERWLKKAGCGLTAAELVMRRCQATVGVAWSLHMQLRMMFVQWINCAIARLRLVSSHHNHPIHQATPNRSQPAVWHWHRKLGSCGRFPVEKHRHKTRNQPHIS